MNDMNNDYYDEDFCIDDYDEVELDELECAETDLQNAIWDNEEQNAIWQENMDIINAKIKEIKDGNS